MNPNKEYLCGKTEQIIKVKDCCTQGKYEFRIPIWIGLRHEIQQIQEEMKELTN